MTRVEQLVHALRWRGCRNKSVIARIASSLQTGVFQFALSRKLSRGTWSCRWEGSLPPLCHVQQIHTAWKTIWSFWSICSLFSEVQPSTSEPEGFLPIQVSAVDTSMDSCLEAKDGNCIQWTNGNPWRMETHCTQKSQNFCISTAEPWWYVHISRFRTTVRCSSFDTAHPQHKIPDYSRKVNDIPPILHVSSCIYTWGSKGPCKDFNCESRACYVGNLAKVFFPSSRK